MQRKRRDDSLNGGVGGGGLVEEYLVDCETNVCSFRRPCYRKKKGPMSEMLQPLVVRKRIAHNVNSIFFCFFHVILFLSHLHFKYAHNFSPALCYLQQIHKLGDSRRTQQVFYVNAEGNCWQMKGAHLFSLA